MQEYRVYIMGGHVQGRVDLLCSDDGDAIEQAKQLVDGRDVELWQRVDPDVQGTCRGVAT